MVCRYLLLYPAAAFSHSFFNSLLPHKFEQSGAENGCKSTIYTQLSAGIFYSLQNCSCQKSGYSSRGWNIVSLTLAAAAKPSYRWLSSPTLHNVSTDIKMLSHFVFSVFATDVNFSAIKKKLVQ